ncbi:hypothetical protein SeMB42_g04523 [Synchytrium endobioticum]|uniref:Ribosomal protein bL31m N-terminal domain-containing protein n=1 Tax=Synchytrium endobioticum TaxID=286115 RepID=A0A507CXN0_9FUNG|nr:hypothetical protein SeMB42_g04523 [Synchytrium endobioticum]TPX45608.1 hypothetical protein SeLEV6574_g03779 [Synchytrium endobioticum]
MGVCLNTRGSIFELVAVAVADQDTRPDRLSIHTCETAAGESGRTRGSMMNSTLRLGRLDRLCRGQSPHQHPSLSPQHRCKSTSRSGIPYHVHPYIFHQTVILSDGSIYYQPTTSPKPVLQLTKDPRNHPLWNPSEKRFTDQAGEISKFEQRFAGLGLDDLVLDDVIVPDHTSSKKK